ncbi:oxidoreductase [Alicyclobacillus hesperidum]|uniref:Oxidoreductase n=1 Tax=Alicyclobacillus hesperidum TaxID=89784 RepID=A0A1H2WXC2_9BACL|nr:Gfo/Idh/MocA family oxidoreductase [Alicyclobacillus hesperidum]GLV13027.1 oxidoreductase [Alicyclobacillus hesperidum]SDW85215.1 Predicted dehydrogenase [Alicyclobacillus hesperidum]
METNYRVIVAGCGGMANTWVDDLLQRPYVQIVALVDIRRESAEAMAARHGLHVPVFERIEDALSAVAANLVIDVTIPESHRAIVTTALRAGCDVLGEKPMGATPEDSRAILTAVHDSGRRYAVMQNRRYHRQLRSLKTALDDGIIGDITSVYADFFIGAHFGGFRDAMEHPLLLDMAIHTFDQARFLLGATPVSVYCHAFNPKGSWYQGAASAICIFEMSDGSIFNYRGSWCAEGWNTSWEATWRIVGSRGTALWDGNNTLRAQVVDEAAEGFIRPCKELEIPVTWQGREGHAGCLDEMFQALAEQRLAETDATDNIHSLNMVFGAIESARTGQKVPL